MGAASSALRDQTWVPNATLHEDFSQPRLESLWVTEVRPHQSL